MAKGQVKKAQAKTPVKTEAQADNMIFALDIGTRSVIGMVGVVEDDKVKIIAIEKEEHTERAMIDGQIENIEKVSSLANKVKRRLESKLHTRLKRVCVAAAGRALRTSRVDYEIELPGMQLIGDETINRLEAGAISKAEELFDAENESLDDSRRFYLVGYTVCQYFLDQYLISSLKEHRGKHIKVDLIATFLPSEVVESLYMTMNKAGLEVASITLEPIAAINAAIPENLRLLNLVMVDIGAGTSDIAACTGGSVTGYTMATVAGDEVTEAVMKEFLVDFKTAEMMKAQLEQDEQVTFTDILGFERTVSRDEVFRCIQNITSLLCKEISEKVLAVNGSAPSALFLAGGGSKLAGLREGITSFLEMDANRVAIAGNNFKANAFSDEYDLNNPEYATPLGIVISSGLNLINDSFRVVLNDKSAKLFRSGSFTVMNLLMMNGYSFQDMLGRPGRPVSVMVNGKRKVFYGTAPQPASLFINKKEGKLSDIVRAGDNIEFLPAISGVSAKPFLGDIEGALDCKEITLNGKVVDLETPLKNGDVIWITLSEAQIAEKEREEEQERAAAVKREAAGQEMAADVEREAEGQERTEATESETVKTEAAADEIPETETLREMPQENLQDWNEEIIRRTQQEQQPEFVVEETMEQKADEIPAEPQIQKEESEAEKTEDFQNVSVSENVPNLSEESTEEKAPNLSGAVITENVSDQAEEPMTEDSSDLPEEFTEERVWNLPEKSIIEGAQNVKQESETEKPQRFHEESSEHGMSQIKLNFGASGTDSVSGTSIARENSFMRTQGQRDIALEKKAAARKETILFQLNGSPIRLPRKKDGSPYYLMDMIERSGIDLKQPKGRVTLSVNGAPGSFQQRLFAGDIIRIEEEE